MSKELVVGHASSRPLSDAERREHVKLEEAKRIVRAAERKEQREQEMEIDRRFTGYRFWCSEGCGFVARNHRCEQWCQLTAIPPAAIEAIQKEAAGVGLVEALTMIVKRDDWTSGECRHYARAVIDATCFPPPAAPKEDVNG